MNILRAVDADPERNAARVEEFAPSVIDPHAVGLNGVAHRDLPRREAGDAVESLLVIFNGKDQWLAGVPDQIKIVRGPA